MIITTKFNLGDIAYPIEQGMSEPFVHCDICHGEGTVIISNKEFTCPACYGSKGERKYIREKWCVACDVIGVIGKVIVEKYDVKYHEEGRIMYMLSSTGVGSGTLWPECNIFISREEAQTECDKRNNKQSNE